MLLKISPLRDGVQWLRYVRGETTFAGHERIEKPEHLSGSFALLEMYAQRGGKYCTGMLSWRESLASVGKEKVASVSRDFLGHMTLGRPSEEFVSATVLHQRKSGFDVHFAISEMHLTSGLVFPHYSSKAEPKRELLRTHRLLINVENGWSDPEDPERQRLTKPAPAYLSEPARLQHENIRKLIERLLLSHEVCSRTELVANLRACGYQILERSSSLKIRAEGESFSLEGRACERMCDYAQLLASREPRPPLTQEERQATCNKLRAKRDSLLVQEQQRMARSFSAPFVAPARLEAEVGGEVRAFTEQLEHSPILSHGSKSDRQPATLLGLLQSAQQFASDLERRTGARSEIGEFARRINRSNGLARGDLPAAADDAAGGGATPQGPAPAGTAARGLVRRVGDRAKQLVEGCTCLAAAVEEFDRRESLMPSPEYKAPRPAWPSLPTPKAPSHEVSR